MSHNTWIHLIVRPLVRPLVKRNVTPNHLTALRLATAVASSLMLASGDPDWSDAAGLVFLISYFLDRADGELARQSGKSTSWGHRFDLFADCTANVLIFVAMGAGLRSDPSGAGAIVLGLVAGVAIVATFWLADHASQMGRGASIVPNVAGFDADDFMIVVPLAIWLDGQRVILTAAAIGAPVFCLWMWWRAVSVARD